MTDHETLELRRIVDSDPPHPAPPDVAGLRAAGGARLRRRRIGLGAAALAVTAAVAAPTYVLTSGAVDEAADPNPLDVSSTGPSGPATSAEDVECGVLSCLEPGAASREAGTVLGSVEVGTLDNGAEELLYVVRTRGVDLRTQETGQVDVLKAGYRLDGEVYGTAWALQPGYEPAAAPRFWVNPGLVGSRDGSTDDYVVLGYVDGSPEEITWSAPDGTTGAVDGVLRMDGYTAFYLTRPLPADFVAPHPVTRNEDGSFTVDTEDGPKTFGEGDSTSIDELIGEHAYEGFPPDLTIHTSDGWSCSLEDCGSMR